MSRPLKSECYPVDAFSVGLRLHNRRQSLSITQEELAAKIGCSSTHINRIESGRLPSLHLLFAMCKALDVSMDEVMDLNPGKNQNVIRLMDLFSRFNEAEQDFTIKLLTDMDLFFHEMHKRSMYNRYSKHQRSYRSPEEDVLFWTVAEDPGQIEPEEQGSETFRQDP